MAGWSSGAPRRGNDERKLYMCPGDAFELLRAHSPQYVQISGRSWRPAPDQERPQAKPYSYWGAADVGSPSNHRSSFPRAAALNLASCLLETKHAELLINFPSFLCHPAMAKRRVTRGGPPPPPSPPQMPESLWGSGEDPADWSQRTRATTEGLLETGEPTALMEFTGVDLMGAFPGPH